MKKAISTPLGKSLRLMLLSSPTFLDLSHLKLTSSQLGIIANIWNQLLKKGHKIRIESVDLSHNYLGIEKANKFQHLHVNPLSTSNTAGFLLFLWVIYQSKVATLDLSHNFLNGDHCNKLIYFSKKYTLRCFINLAKNPLSYYLQPAILDEQMSDTVTDYRPYQGLNGLLTFLMSKPADPFLFFFVTPLLRFENVNVLHPSIDCQNLHLPSHLLKKINSYNESWDKSREKFSQAIHNIFSETNLLIAPLTDTVVQYALPSVPGFY